MMRATVEIGNERVVAVTAINCGPTGPGQWPDGESRYRWTATLTARDRTVRCAHGELVHPRRAGALALTRAVLAAAEQAKP